MGIYSSPEDYGLTVVAEVEAGEAWSWDGAVVYRKEDDTLVGGTDSTCSCFPPFDGLDVSDLSVVETLDDAEGLLNALHFTPPATERLDFLNAVRKALPRPVTGQTNGLRTLSDLAVQFNLPGIGRRELLDICREKNIPLVDGRVNRADTNALRAAAGSLSASRQPKASGEGS